MPRQGTKKKKADSLLLTPKGMHDILPPETLMWEKLRRATKDVADFYDFEFIETPIVELEEVFRRGVGLDTDVVEKQMFNLKTRGGDRMVLRPENTAGVVRAYIQHGMANWPQPVKLWYWGPMFRHENPQSGRYRQFHQIGFENFGEEHPAVDVEIMQVTAKILEAIGLKGFHLEVNSIGCANCRPAYKNLLKSYYRNRANRLCPDCRRRLKTNPLRLLDCKNEVCVLMKGSAPETVENLCEECRAHFKKVLEFLDDAEIPYLLNPYLVRGLDYYSRTVFEVVPSQEKEGLTVDSSGSSPKSIAGGGRYDYLTKMLGGNDTPAVGVSVGIERTLSALKDQGVKFPVRATAKVFLAQLGELAKRKSLKLLEDFRRADLRVATTLGRDSVKAQLKVADRMGVSWALILGQKEAVDHTIILRDMQTGVQETIPLDKIVEEIKERLREK
jgi:histidyl-tRNA synthetase